MLAVFAKLKVKTGGEEDFLAVANDLVKFSRKELENITYDFCKSDTVENEYFFIERWESHTSLESHQNSRHYIEAMDVFEDLVEDRQVIIGKSL
nr:putative quinol monooxygenase [uncultured Peptostreptococcus sp.]